MKLVSNYSNRVHSIQIRKKHLMCDKLFLECSKRFAREANVEIWAEWPISFWRFNMKNFLELLKAAGLTIFIVIGIGCFLAAPYLLAKVNCDRSPVYVGKIGWVCPGAL